MKKLIIIIIFLILGINSFPQNGKVVGTIMANDPDSGQRLTFVQMNIGVFNRQAFSVSKSGVITINSQKMINSCNCGKFNFIVRVSDSGKPSLWSQVIITILVNPKIVLTTPGASKKQARREEKLQRKIPAGVHLASFDWI